MAKKIKQIEAFEARRAELQKSTGGDVYLVAVPKDNEGKDWTACYLKKPDRATVSNALSLQTQGRVLDASEVILRSAWIEGDQNILDDDDLFYAAHATVQGMIEFRLGVLKKN